MAQDDQRIVAISSQPGLSPDEVARRSFTSVRRGYDSDAVRQFLSEVSSALKESLDRQQLLAQRLRESERRAAEPELDEQTIVRAVGAETAKILETAHAAATEVVSRAESRAAEIVSEAEALVAARSEEVESEATAILTAARLEAASLTEAAATQGAAVTDAARSEAVALLEATRAECRRVVRQARERRSEILADLAERHRGLRVQLEQLRAGRDLLVSVVDSVGETTDELRERLAGAEHEARVAAADAGAAAEAVEEAPELTAADDLDESLLAEVSLGETEEERSEAPSPATAGVVDFDELSPADEPEEEGGAQRSVEELFAQIRAERRDESASSEEAPSEPTPAAASDGKELSPDERGVLGEHSAHEAAVAETEKDPAPGSSQAPADEQLDGENREVPEPEELFEESQMRRRSELLDPVAIKLARALKRALQDDQNLLMDAIRHGTKKAGLAELLPEEAERERLSEATAPVLAEAWSKGHLFIGSPEPTKKAATVAGARIAGELAAEVTAQLRHRLGESLSGLEDGGEPSADAAGAAYREWRGKRVEVAAGDFATKSFSEAAVAAAAGQLVRWVVDDDGQPCPDCDDNALAGPMALGEEFPTGQAHPPVHPGCRCLLVAVTS